MPTRWRLSSLSQTFEVAHRSDAPDLGVRRAVPFDLAAALFHCIETPSGQLTLREMYQRVHGLPALRFADGPRREDLRRLVIPAIERAFEGGLLVVLAQTRPHGGTAGGRAEEPEEVRDERPVDTRLTWIEIELVDENDSPVPGARYELALPDGSVQSGTLDRQGFARVDGIAAGSCVVTFPAYDRRSWEAA